MTDTAETLSNLLAILADPAKFKQKLHEWEAAVKKHDAAKEQSLAAQKQANATLQQINIRGDQVDAREEKLNQREKELTAGKDELERERAEFRAYVLRIQHDLASRERDVGKREQAAPHLTAFVEAAEAAAKRRAGK